MIKPGMGYILRQYKRYAVLARGCLGAGSIEKAANVVRAAYRLNPQGLSMPQRAPGVEMRALEEVMNALSASPNAERLAVRVIIFSTSGKV